jgi:lysozyme
MDNSTEIDLPLGSGPFLARVENHLDSTLMGRLEVKIFLGSTIESVTSAGTFTVKYLPQFAGQTQNVLGSRGNDSSKFNDVQKSYGMWFVPPDVGTIVMVIFVNGDYNEGYWFGCVPNQYQNHMVPGIAASADSAMTEEQRRKYMTSYVPVAEFSKDGRDLSIGKIDHFTKPVHPFADRLLAQGLLLDTIRGVTSSSARRETPSSVFGISTPGPIDTSTDAPKAQPNPLNPVRIPVSRLGGHTFVMDDGRLIDDPLDKSNNPRKVLVDEAFRIRTRTGHQILLHNSSDLIYIANAAGTSWIELTAQGKVDIYAADSVSIHSENDINLRADRDFNIEGGRSVNIAAGNNIQLESVTDINVLAGQNFALQSGQDGNILAGTDLNIGATSDLNLNGAETVKVGSAGEAHVVAQTTFLTAAGQLNLSAGGNLIESGAAIHLNGPAAGIGIAPASPTGPTALARYTLPNRVAGGSWSDGNFYKASDLVSIMTRIPTHEPYDQHENVNPAKYNVDGTDSQSSTGPSSAGALSAASIEYKRNPALSPPVPTGDVPTDNLAAFMWMIRRAEGTADAEGYRAQFPSSHFAIDDPKLGSYQYKDHPRTVQIARGAGGVVLKSSAAGAYQWLTSTWDEYRKLLNLPDFSPASQDKAVILLFQRKNALEDIKLGNFTRAVNKLHKIWASLPGANYAGQNTRSINQVLSYYKEGGGVAVA